MSEYLPEVALTKPQREVVEWALDPMVDFWNGEEGRIVENPIVMTPKGCKVASHAGVIDDLRYRLTEQLPDMADDEFGDDTIAFRNECRAAENAWEKVRGVVPPDLWKLVEAEKCT